MSSSSPPSPPAAVVVAPSRYVVSLESKSIASPTSPIVAIAAATTASTGSARCRGKPQETNSKELLHRRCRRQKKYRSHAQVFYDRHVRVVEHLQVISRHTRKVGMLDDDELYQLQEACAGFGEAFRIAYPKRGGLLTPKGHIVANTNSKGFFLFKIIFVTGKKSTLFLSSHFFIKNNNFISHLHLIKILLFLLFHR